MEETWVTMPSIQALMDKNQKNSLWDKKVRKNLVARAFNQSECLEACVGQI